MTNAFRPTVKLMTSLNFSTADRYDRYQIGEMKFWAVPERYGLFFSGTGTVRYENFRIDRYRYGTGIPKCHL